MSVHENETMSAVVHAAADVTPGDAERIVGAFLLALGELDYEVPSNSYRAILTRAGLKIEVFDDGKPAVKTYGTPAPVEEVAEFLGEEPAHFDVGDEVLVTGDSKLMYHGRAGRTGEIVEIHPDRALVATSPTRRAWGLGPRDARWVAVEDLERA